MSEQSPMTEVELKQEKAKEAARIAAEAAEQARLAEREAHMAAMKAEEAARQARFRAEQAAKVNAQVPVRKALYAIAANVAESIGHDKVVIDDKDPDWVAPYSFEVRLHAVGRQATLAKLYLEASGDAIHIQSAYGAGIAKRYPRRKDGTFSFEKAQEALHDIVSNRIRSDEATQRAKDNEGVFLTNVAGALKALGARDVNLMPAYRGRNYTSHTEVRATLGDLHVSVQRAYGKVEVTVHATSAPADTPVEQAEAGIAVLKALLGK